jgi:anti-sigma regulatory factor (Ser/Thr protein kinase)
MCGATQVTDHPFADVPPPAGPGVVRHWRANYDNVPGSVGAARDLARAFLVEAVGEVASVSQRTAQDVLLVVSELATNAARHDGGPRMLDLVCTADALEVTVWDTSSQLPERFPPDPARIGGHGIEIVTHLCSTFEAQRVPGGKRVRARITLP